MSGDGLSQQYPIMLNGLRICMHAVLLNTFDFKNVDTLKKWSGKFGEHERSIRVARGVAESNSSFSSKYDMQTANWARTNSSITKHVDTSCGRKKKVNYNSVCWVYQVIVFYPKTMTRQKRLRNILRPILYSKNCNFSAQKRKKRTTFMHVRDRVVDSTCSNRYLLEFTARNIA